jgi:hypothetical protein
MEALPWRPRPASRCFPPPRSFALPNRRTAATPRQRPDARHRGYRAAEHRLSRPGPGRFAPPPRGRVECAACPYRATRMAAHQSHGRLSLGRGHRHRPDRVQTVAWRGSTIRRSRMISRSVPLSVNPGPFYGVPPLTAVALGRRLDLPARNPATVDREAGRLPQRKPRRATRGPREIALDISR